MPERRTCLFTEEIRSAYGHADVDDTPKGAAFWRNRCTVISDISRSMGSASRAAVMSVLPHIRQREWHVCLVPIADLGGCTMSTNFKPIPPRPTPLVMLNSQSTCRTPTVSHVLLRLRIVAAPAKRDSSRHRPRAIAAQFEMC